MSGVSQQFHEMLKRLEPVNIPASRIVGRLCGVSGLLLKAQGCGLATGQRCMIEVGDGQWIHAQMVGFNGIESYLMPLKSPLGLVPGARVLAAGHDADIYADASWLGRVINGMAEAIDGLGELTGAHRLKASAAQVHPLRKSPIKEILDVGIRAINGPLTLGRGQRVGLLAGSGVGKSVLLGMMTQYTNADVIIVGMIGERGREVREFIENTLGERGRRRAVVVVATADSPALMRTKATELCHVLAAFFRDQGAHVLLLIDSLTRYAMALREIALSLGEAPAMRGYPASVFARLPELIEGAGNGEGAGSMSAIYTVLAEGDDPHDPVLDTARSILDGHIVLSRDLAERGHYPAIDISRSVSRCMRSVVSQEQLAAAQDVKALLNRYEQIRELIPLGAYVAGADAFSDKAVALAPRIETFLRQGIHDGTDFKQTHAQLMQVLI